MRNVIDCINAFIPLLSTEYGPVILRNIMIKLERAGGQYDYRRKTDEENTGSEWI